MSLPRDSGDDVFGRLSGSNSDGWVVVEIGQILVLVQDSLVSDSVNIVDKSKDKASRNWDQVLKSLNSNFNWNKVVFHIWAKDLFNNLSKLSLVNLNLFNWGILLHLLLFKDFINRVGNLFDSSKESISPLVNDFVHRLFFFMSILKVDRWESKVVKRQVIKVEVFLDVLSNFIELL